MARSAKYLGVQLGPGALVIFWEAAAQKYWSRLLDECQVRTGMADRIRRYARRVFPVLRYLLQFRAPSAALLALEGRALQRLVAGPWAGHTDAIFAALGSAAAFVPPVVGCCPAC